MEDLLAFRARMAVSERETQANPLSSILLRIRMRPQEEFRRRNDLCKDLLVVDALLQQLHPAVDFGQRTQTPKRSTVKLIDQALGILGALQDGGRRLLWRQRAATQGGKEAGLAGTACPAE